VKVVGAAALAALVLAGASASAAERAFPGRNGRIVFVSDRATPLRPEVYAVPVAGGRPANLTRNAAWDSAPLPSPDGTRILFGSDRQGHAGLWVMGAAGGPPRLLGTGERPAWAPDGRRVAFEDGRGQIAVLEVESGALRTLVRGSLPAWSPDGARIAFVGVGRGPELHVVSGDGEGERRLAPGAVLSGVIVRPPAWSPDGTRIAFAGGGADANGSAASSDLYVARVSDGAASVLVRGPGISAPSWSPDGRGIVFVRAPRDVSGSELVLVSADGGAIRRLTTPSRPLYEGGPAWSPNGSWIAFWRGRGDTNGNDVMLVRPDGTGLRRLTPPRVALPAYEGPVWARDGRSVLYASSSSDRDADLFTTEPDGRRLRRLTNNLTQDTEPAWSPDGAQIAFVRLHLSDSAQRPSFNEELYVMRADGSAVRRLTHRAFEDLSPSWSPDGSRIAFVRRVRQRGLLAVYTMHADGGGVRRLTRREAFYVVGVDRGGVRRLSEVGGHGVAWSPDGSEVAVGRGELAALSADGSRSRRITYAGTNDHSPDWQPRCTRSGTARTDRLRGTAGAELVCGLGGADRIVGGRGGDRLFGGDGDDTIDARDGAFDVVGCGPGWDTVAADRRDVVGVDCERVSRG
jgi:Tol biopolymer transport system component